MIRSTRVAKTGDVKVTFVLPKDEPQGNVSVVGDFNEWRPGKHVMAKRTNGTRSLPPHAPDSRAITNAAATARDSGDHFFISPQLPS